MRTTALALIGALGAATAALSAQAAPAAPVADHTGSSIVLVAGGCGPGFHPTPWGRCMPFHHRWHARMPGDDSADFLNREQLRQGY